jgi:hypothetical protein
LINGTADAVNLSATLPEPTVEDVIISTFPSASLVCEAVSPTVYTSWPRPNRWLTRRESLALGPPPAWMGPS